VQLATAPGQSTAPRPRSGRLLGDVLVELGFCDREAVESAVIAARETGIPMGQVLLDRHVVRSHQLGIAIAERFGLAFISHDELEPDLAALNLMPSATIKRLDAVPIGFAPDNALLVAMADPRNLLALDDLALLTDRRVKAVVVTREDLDALLARVERIEGGLIEDGPEPAPDDDAEEELASTADEGPTVKLVRSIIADAIEQGASDVHFEPRDGALNVRYRVDGMMRKAARIPTRQAARVISRIKILSNLDISERRAPQDGRTSLTVDGRRIDVRVAIIPLVAGESAVLRVLDPGDGPLLLDALGMGVADRARIETALSRAQGAILATGPTGSGKSTTLYAALSRVGAETNSVMTIEDPVEYRLPEIKQMQVHERAGVTFASGLRAIVRADPDVIMVGEMRDRESAKVAIEAALTGHQVLSTLHTNSAAAAPARLMEMGVEPYLLSSALDCVIGQRLARRLCGECRRAVKVPGADAGAPQLAEIELFEAVGCNRCHGTGYRGRVGLYEILTVSPEIGMLINARATASEIEAVAVAEGMTTLRADGLAKVRAGHTSLAELTRVLG
jgi:type IV pilus assembly protein PilB